MDTPSWSDEQELSSGCEWYQVRCKNGNPKPEKEHLFGKLANYPEENCCGCGKTEGK